MKSREIFYEGGDRVEKAFVAHLASVDAKKEKHQSLVENNPEFQEILDGIDFDVLKDILRKEVEHSGIATEDANVLGKSDIFCSKKTLALCTLTLTARMI